MFKRNLLKGRVITIIIESRSDVMSAIPRTFKTMGAAREWLTPRIGADRTDEAIADTMANLERVVHCGAATYRCMHHADQCLTLCTTMLEG